MQINPESKHQALESVIRNLDAAVKEVNNNPQLVLELSGMLLGAIDRLPPESERLMDEQAACIYLGIKPRTLAKCRSASKIPYLKIPGVGVRYDPKALRTWARAHQRQVHPAWRGKAS
jgi:hypothetical protein